MVGEEVKLISNFTYRIHMLWITETIPRDPTCKIHFKGDKG